MIQLRPFQVQALDALSSPGHVICVAPTGSGKSLIYERSAQTPGKRTVLVTPLIALGRQQHQRLSRYEALSSALGTGQPSQGPPLDHDTGVWIISPEKLQIPSQLRLLKKWKPNFLVVDECHCLWEWGESFRPAFQRLPELIQSESISSSLWLTATLPMHARSELKSALPDPLTEIGEFDLPAQLELWITQLSWTERIDALVHWVRQQASAGIVFVSTRESAERVARLLRATGKKAISYHAGMGSEERQAIEHSVSEAEVIVATSAFGMGMDYPHLEWVALWQAPLTLLSLAQSIGRVARGSARRARALVFWHDEDFRLLEWSLRGSVRRKEQLQLVQQFLHAHRCRRLGLRTYFESSQIHARALSGDPNCGRCDYCLRIQ